MQLARGPFWGWRLALPFLLLLLAGGTFALSTSSAGRADDPPPTTVSTPTVPAPVPAPAPAPRVVKPPRKSPTPKSTPRKTPRATVESRRLPRHLPSPRRPLYPRRLRCDRRKPRSECTKSIGKRRPAHPRKAPAARLAPQRALGASVSFRNQAGSKSTSSFDVSSLVLILGLAIAAVCFSFALIPARALPWRQVATFRSERQVDMTLIGLALLATTFLLYLLTRV